MTLLPNGSSTPIDWEVNGESSRHECLDDDNGDTSYVDCNDDGANLDLTFANPSVAEGDIDTITSVQFTSSGRRSARGRGGSNIDIAFLQPSAGLSETMNYQGGGSYETENGTVRTQTPAGADWTYANLEDLEFRLTKNGDTFVRLSYFALIVVYVAAVAAVDNATFFGANF